MESPEADRGLEPTAAPPPPARGAVVRVVDGGRHRLIELELERRLAHMPAQVVAATTGHGEASWFAIASPPGAAHLALLVRRSDPPEGLDTVRTGDAVEISGPYGAGFGLTPASRYLLAGVGSAWGALRSAVLALEAVQIPPSRMAIALGIRRTADLPDRAELERLAALGAEVVVAISREQLTPVPDAGEGIQPPSGIRWVPGRVPRAIAALAPFAAPEALGLLAGSDEAEVACVEALLARGVSFDRIQRNYHPDHRSGAIAPASPATHLEVAPPAGIEPAQDKD